MNFFRFPTSVFSVLFALFCCTITGVADFVFVGNAIHRWHATKFSTTTGRIVESSFRARSKGNADLNIRYRFRVNEHEYEGTKARADRFDSSVNIATAREIVRANPKGAQRTIYYNPADPNDCALRVGIDGSDLFLIMFLTPFNLIGLSMLAGPLLEWRRRFSRSELPGLQVIRRRMQTILRVPTMGPTESALAALFFATFLGSAAVALTGSGFFPGLQKVTIAWTVVGAVTVGVFIWRTIRLHSGADDLIINQADQSVSLPLTFGRKKRLLLSRSQIKGVGVRQRIQYSSRGSKSVWHQAGIHCEGDIGTHGSVLAEYLDRPSAERLVNWLREQLGLEEKPHPAENSKQ